MFRIRFDSKEDRVRGFYELAIKGIVRALKGDVFEIPEHCKKILDDAGVSYRILTENEGPVDEAQALRNTPTH
ncbi:MAG TPA: hypothetical protein ACFYD6_11040 [Candidatus Brocadiia bacterium]|nr:hypothetical protein [Candidatus Brocadiales bacterium]